MNPARFFREVRQETGKVSWPTRQETVVTTIMVFIMVILVSVFLMFVDWSIGEAIQFLLNLGA